MIEGLMFALPIFQNQSLWTSLVSLTHAQPFSKARPDPFSRVMVFMTPLSRPGFPGKRSVSGDLKAPQNLEEIYRGIFIQYLIYT